jgi:hypothetical protein
MKIHSVFPLLRVVGILSLVVGAVVQLLLPSQVNPCLNHPVHPRLVHHQSLILFPGGDGLEVQSAISQEHLSH